MNRIVLFWTMVLATFATIHAENIKFTASVSDAVVKGEQFRLIYTVNAEARDLRAPDMPDFEVLMGPSKSSYSSMQIVNGSVTQDVSNTFTYILMANKEGTFTIPPATILANGKKFTSNAVTVKVVPPDKAARQQNQSRSNNAGSSSSSSNANVSGDNLFAKLTLSSRRIYEQQFILATIKLYSRYDVGIENVKFPEFNGFLAEEINIPEPQWTIENINGVNYRTVTLKQSLLFPQRTGKLNIGACKLNMIVRIQNKQRGQSIFDEFFESYQDVRKVITTQPATVEVIPLPSGKPASFNGAVGDFSINSSISTTNPKANEAVTIKLVISGNGNMKLLKNPTVSFPADFEVYDPKVTNLFKTTTSGSIGNKVIEYLAIPRYAGKFKIPGVIFSYFDTKSNSYKTVQTKDYELNVSKGTGGSSQQVVSDFTNKESLKLLGQDIRFIKTEELKLTKMPHYLFGSLSYWLYYIIPFILFIVLFIIFRKKARENANLALMRTKKANKVATKRLKMAAKYLHANNHDAFYDETLKALWGYLSDKLSIPVSELTKENIESELTKFGVQTELLITFREILDRCEFARYAPVKSSEGMNNTYEQTVEAIGIMEKIVRK